MNKKERKKLAKEQSEARIELAHQIMDAIIKNNTKLVLELFEKSEMPMSGFYLSVNEYASDPGVLGNIAYYPIKANNAEMLKLFKKAGVNINGEIRFLTDWNSRADQFLSEKTVSCYDFAVNCGCSKEILDLIKAN